MGLLAGSALTPWLVEGMVRLGAAMPFDQVPPLLAYFTGVAVSGETVRRLTEAAGVAAVAVATEEVAELERMLPKSPAGPTVQQLSVDGAMVPLVGGIWAEVRTLVLGTVAQEDATTRTTDLSYFSRLTDAETFGRLATGETHRRGTSRAGTVVAVVDGAPWCQEFVDLHRPDAVRILDVAHAMEHLGTVARTVFRPGTEAASEWLGQQAHALRHGQEDAVLAELRGRATDGDLDRPTREVVEQTHAYLAKRREQLRYQAFAAAGYPIGSGCVESANKLLVEARLKGAGMHWARANVNPMLALRTLRANGRWDEAWPMIWDRLRHPPRDPVPPSSPPIAPPVLAASVPDVPTAVPTPRPKTIVNGTPTADHPWRRSLPFRAKR